MCSDRGRKGDGVAAAAATGRRAKGDGVVHGLASPPKRGARGILKLGRNMARSVGRRGGGEDVRSGLREVFAGVDSSQWLVDAILNFFYRAHGGLA